MPDVISTLKRISPAHWIVGGTGFAALIAVTAVLVWPASAADKARDDGERVGAAVTQLYEAGNSVELAVDDLYEQAGDFRAQGPEVHQAFWDGVNDGLSVS
jgi:hypothetical protein